MERLGPISGTIKHAGRRSVKPGKLGGGVLSKPAKLHRCNQVRHGSTPAGGPRKPERWHKWNNQETGGLRKAPRGPRMLWKPRRKVRPGEKDKRKYVKGD